MISVLTPPNVIACTNIILFGKTTLINTMITNIDYLVYILLFILSPKFYQVIDQTMTEQRSNKTIVWHIYV